MRAANFASDPYLTRPPGSSRRHDRSPDYISHIKRLHRDTVSDSRGGGFKNCLMELNVQVVIKDEKFELVPIR